VAFRDRGLAQLAPRLVLLVLFAGLATLHTWPMPSDPAHLTRLDNDDTAFNTWVIAWVQHQLTRDPLALFDAPIFYPARHALAFSEHMFVQSVMGLPMHWAGLSPVLIYNVLVWLGYALSGFAMALLVRSWTGSTLGGVVSGCLYAFNAHLLTRYAHLQALHLEFLPIVFYAFDRILRGAQRRDVALLAAAFVAQALCSNYTMVLMTAALVIGLVVRAEAWRGGRAMWGALLVAGIIAGALLAPFLYPYYRVRAEQGLVRTIDDIRLYSAGVQDYLATAGRFHYDWWSHRFFAGRATLFPGVLGFLLALTAVVRGIAWKDPRARMALAFGVAGFALSFGASLPGYAWMQEHIPLLQGIRAVARWGLLFLIAVAILAGFATAWLESRWRHARWWPAFAVAMVAVITLEAVRAPLAMHYHAGIDPVHRRLAAHDITAMVIYPLYGGAYFNMNAPYLLHQTEHWKPMLNAYSSFAPPIFYSLAETLQQFPSEAAITALRTHGFSHVLLHRAPLERDHGRAAVDALRSHRDLELVFDAEGLILYRVR
jgi:hypothetical protein